MLDKGNKALAGRMKLALKQSELFQKDIAAACGVSVQAVSGWLKTGKVDKGHLSKIAALTRVNVAWLLTGDGDPNAHSTPVRHGIAEMPQMPYTKGQRVLDQLGIMIEIGQLTDDDMVLLGQIAKRFQKEQKS